MLENPTIRQIPRDLIERILQDPGFVRVFESLLYANGEVFPANIAEVAQDLADHIADPVGAHAASAISNIPAGQISAINVQDAINELDDDVQTRLLKADMVGAVQWFARATPPNANWLPCSGQAVSRTTYAALFAYLGTFWGAGDGSTTFNLPDLRGEFLRGWDNGRGIDPARAFGSSQGDELRSHTHNYNMSATSGFQADFGADFVPLDTFTTTATSNTGGSETRPRNIALLPCIHV